MSTTVDTATEIRSFEVNVPEKAIEIHRMPAAASWTGRPSRTKPNANTSTHASAKKTVVKKISPQ